MQFRCAALLFDLDGVLVDSHAVVERISRRWALGHHLDPEMVLRVAHGRRSSDTVKAAAPHLDATREAAWIDAAELDDVEGLKRVTGAGELLATLPASRWTVVTSCGRALAERRLTAAGLAVPKLIVTAEDVSKGKPAPDGYRLGAERLGRDAATCVAFEDAPAGIAAARGAGARVIGLTTMLKGYELPGADATIPDFSALRVHQEADALIITIG
jgi:sugar-phosphatase